MRGAAKEEMFCGTFLLYILRMRRRRVHGFINVLSESFLYLPLWLIFRQPHPNFINVRTAYASEIWAQLTKNHLSKSSTERFREYIYVCASFLYHILPKPPAPFPPVRQYILHLRPETRGMVHFQPVCQLMDNHIIHQLLRQKCQPPVKI